VLSVGQGFLERRLGRGDALRRVGVRS